MTIDNPCKHDLLGVLHCKKCGEQYHVDWLEALRQTKMEAVGEVLDRIQSTIKMKSKQGKVQNDAQKLALKSIKEVQDVYNEIITQQNFIEAASKFPDRKN